MGEELAANSLWANTKSTVKLLRSGLGFNVHRWVDDTVRRFRGQQLSGILGTCDYPSCFLASAIAERLGLPAPPLRDIVLMGHKYYSRQLHTAVIPEATPDYEPLDPRRPWLGALPFPVFVKPVKGCTSARAQLAHHPGELRTILRFDAITRLRLLATLKPYQQLLTHHCDGDVPAHWFIAETPLAGAQATVDGFVQNGHITVQGVVDSVMYPGTNNFRRFDYPSHLPSLILARMVELTRRLVAATGLDHTCFNVEFFYDPARDTIHVIELNPRMSYQFSDLYRMADGTSTYTVQLDLATGRTVHWNPQAGRYRVATSFVLRRFSNAQVTRVPHDQDIAALRGFFPDSTVVTLVAAGKLLSEIRQDVDSFRYAIVNLGGADAADLDTRWETARTLLPFSFD
ncbi:MAG: hypothetical protein WCF33_01120 [Pseudonocardiaceae bacterium]